MGKKLNPGPILEPSVGQAALCWTQGRRDKNRSPSRRCLPDAPWHLAERGSASWPRVTTCDSHWVSRHVSVGWRAEALILCIWLPCLAVLNCLVDGVGAGRPGKQKPIVYTHPTKQTLVSTPCLKSQTRPLKKNPSKNAPASI